MHLPSSYLILLADAETPDDKLFAATIALHALDAKQQGAKYGPRGLCDQQKSSTISFTSLQHFQNLVPVIW